MRVAYPLAVFVGLIYSFVIGAGVLLADEPFSHDASSIWEASVSVKYFYDSGWREPLQPALVRLVSLTGPTGIQAVRIVCALSSLLCFSFILSIGWKRIGPLGGVLAAALWGWFNPYLLHYGVSGDRLTLVSALLLGFAHLLLRVPASPRRTVGLAIVGGLLPLLRSETLFVVIAAFCLRGLHKWNRSESKALLMAGGAAFLLFIPYPAAEYFRTGNPFYGSAMHARSWANHEFHGPGGLHATLKGVHADEYRGGPLSPSAYIFGMHTPGEVAVRYVKGYARLLIFYMPEYATPHLIVYLIALGGAVVLVRRKRADEVAFVLLAHFPFAFIYPLDQIAPGSGIEARYSLQTAPFLALWAAEAVYLVTRRLKDRA